MLSGRSRVLSGFSVIAVIMPLSFMLAARAAEDPSVPVPLGPGAAVTLLDKATTSDPVEIRTSGPSEIEFARLNVAPGGTTGLSSYNGTAVVSVHRGVATIVSDGDGGCTSKTVTAGSASVQPAKARNEIRNDGSQPLQLYATSVTPAGTPISASAPATSCETRALSGVTTEVLNRSTIDAPFTAESTGSSDVYVVVFRAQPDASIGGWHTHPRAALAGVQEGQLTTRNSHNGRCDTAVVPAGAGFVEPPNMLHEVRNDSTSPLTFYALAFAPTPQPFATPSPAPAECMPS